MVSSQNFAFHAVFQSRLEPGDWDWTAISSIATGVAAIVTAVTIVFIFKQTRATRVTAEQAERSADAAFQALEHSQKQLDYAQRQHVQSMFMTAEAVKARIDAQMPRLLVQSAAVVPAEALDQNGTPLVFVEPEDDARELMHLMKFQMKNDGPGSAKLRFSAPIKYHTMGSEGQESIQQLAEAEQVIALGVGDTLNGEYIVRRTIRDWIRDFEAKERREQSLAHQLTVRSLTDADTGAHELHYITLAGTALVPLPQHKGAWVHRNRDDMKENLVAFVEPIERMYFLSRRRNQRLPEIDWMSSPEAQA